MPWKTTRNFFHGVENPDPPPSPRPYGFGFPIHNAGVPPVKSPPCDHR